MLLGSYPAVGNCECDSGTLVTFQGLRMGTLVYLANLTNFETVLLTVAACIPEAEEEYAVVCHLCLVWLRFGVAYFLCTDT